MPTIPYGYCHCGCGEKTTVPAKLYAKQGRFPGVPVKFKRGHYPTEIRKARSGELAPAWRGGKMTTKNGYVLVKAEENPMADPYGRVYEHRLVMAEHIGRPLRREEHVHHLNGVKHDNRVENLLLFPSTAEHHAYHAWLRRELQEEMA